MKINCPSCKRAYKVDESRIQDQGLAMRCPQCGSSFVVSSGGIVGDVRFGSFPPLSKKESSSILPRRPSESPRVPILAPLSLEDDSSAGFDFRQEAVTVEPSSPDQFELARKAQESARGGPAKDSWGFEVAPYSESGGESLPKKDPFADLGLAGQTHDSKMEIGDLGVEDDIDLPAPVDHSQRETRAIPSVSGSAQKASAKADPFGEIDFGLAVKHSPKKAPAPPPAPAPLPISVSSAPPAPRISAEEAGFGDLRLSDFDKPTSRPSASESAAGFGASSDRLSLDLLGEGGDSRAAFPPLGASLGRQDMVPASPNEIKLASVPPPGGVGYGEFDLGSESSSPAEGEFDIAEAKARPSIPGGQPRLPSLRPAAADSSHEFKGLSTSRGDDSTGRGKLELAIDPQEGHSQPGHIVDEGLPGKTGKKGKAFGGWRRLERQSRKIKLAFLGGLLFVVAVGVGLHWTPWGLFGTQAIVDLLPHSMANKIIQEKEVLVSEALVKDDFHDCQTAYGELSGALGELTREEDLRLLGVFLIYYMDARFGEDKRLSDEAVKLLGGINLDKSKSRWAPLVQAARDVKAGTYDSGRIQPPEPSLGNHWLALQVLFALKKADSNAALPLAQKLLAAEKNAPRANFLLARSLALAGKVEDALGALDSLLSIVPKHLEGAALLARALLDVRPLPVDRIQQVAEGVVAKARPSVAAQGRAVLARLHYRLRHIKEAKQQAEQALAAHPDEPLALVVSGDIALHEGDTVLAATMFHKALARASKDLSASLGLVEVKLHEGKLTEAKDAAQGLVAANPGSARGHYVMGLALDAIEPTDEARAELLKAIELDSEGLDAYLALAQSYMKSKRDSDAMAVLDKAAETLPGNPLIARTLADAQGARGDYAAAIVELNKAVEMAPDDPETYFMMAQMYRKMGSFVDARNTLAEVERRAADFPGLAVERGLVMELEGDLTGALKEYEKALAESPESPAAKIRVGAVAHALGENSKAETVLAEAVSALPNSAEASYLLGEVYRVTKRPSEAMRLFQVAKEIDRSSGLYALRFGMSLLDLGDHVGAKRAFEEAKTKAPELAEVYLMLGEVLLLQGAARDAIETAQKALRLQPTLLEAHKVLGRAYEELSDFRAARTHYRVAAKALTEDGELHFWLGLAELKMSGERASLPPLERAVRIVEQTGERPAWLSEALFRLGMAQVAVGQRGAAIASLERYFEVAPENHIDRAEVRANLERLRD